MKADIDKNNYYLNEIYNSLDNWREIIQIGGNLLLSLDHSNIITFYEFFITDRNNLSKINVSKSTCQINIKEDITNMTNISRMNDGSLLGSINDKILIIKFQKNKDGNYNPKCYLLNIKDNNILKVFELSNGKLLICDNSNTLNIFKYSLNKTENNSKSAIKSFFKKISNSIKTDNILEKESEIICNYNFNDDKNILIMEISYNNSKPIIILEHSKKTLIYYDETIKEKYNKIFEIQNVSSQYLAQICNGYLIGFCKDNKTK
jgi:hypothetical protein